MMGSEVLEIAIGIVFIYLIVSLVATTIREAIEGLLKTRAIHLERGIRELLDDPTGNVITTQLFNHPLLFSLFAGRYDPNGLKDLYRSYPGKVLSWFRTKIFKSVRNQPTAKRMGFGTDLPSYIPSRNFALALLHLVSGAGTDRSGIAPSLETVKFNLLLIPDSKLKQAMLVAVAESKGDFDRARASLEAWFDGTMDRVSGWYKRETSWILFFIGLVAAIALNINTIAIARQLASHNSLRQALVTHVEATYPAIKDKPKLTEDQLRAQVADLSSIIGYSTFKPGIDYEERRILNAQATADEGLKTSSLKQKFVDAQMGTNTWRRNDAVAIFVAKSMFGWIISALAISLGAPFWFDMLNKLMVVRSTVKPYEKSASEGSADRTAAPTPDTLLNPVAGVAGAAVAPTQPATPAVRNKVAGPSSTADIRLAFDLSNADPTTLQFSKNGSPIDVPKSGMIELPLEIGAAHTLSATASTVAGSPLTWSQTLVAIANDDGRPITAILA